MKDSIGSVVFISNFYNHHQAPFSQAMFRLIGDGYRFIETEAIPEERLAMGWGERELPNFVVSFSKFQNDSSYAQDMIDRADTVIFGSAPSFLLDHRIKTNKQIFRYSERPLKVDVRWKYPFRLITWRKAYPQKNNIFMLCASGYTAGDFAKFGLFRSRCYKWGYFPETKQYSENELMAKKRPSGCLSILWAGRMLYWKHPEAVVELAELLRSEGLEFCLDMIGNGEMEEKLRSLIKEKGLTDRVRLLGAMPPERVRQHMEEANIFLFTSDFNEGWGAVLNEAMNSGCAVVASHAIGSVPYLVKDGENGMIYKNGDLADLHAKVVKLMTEPKLRESMGREAYRTITGLWNAQTAAERFLDLAHTLKKGEYSCSMFTSGPCSRAEVLHNDWYERRG